MVPLMKLSVPQYRLLVRVYDGWTGGAHSKTAESLIRLGLITRCRKTGGLYITQLGRERI